ncbi:MAG: hypothetical protein J6S14_06825 [Clostridia bacterium]|nr:hypothetical protein [Clostridia bacterium]
MLFRKSEINPYSVSDKVRFRNIDKVIELNVRADASILVVNLMKANKRISTLSETSPDDEQRESALMFAGAVFGQEQAEKLMQFYDEEPLAVINACGIYFRERLAKKITKAQKKE